MAANTTRAGIEAAKDYYLMPLPATIVPTEVLDTYLKQGRDKIEAFEPICRYIEKLLLDDAVLIYREEYFIERAFGRLKGKSLSLTPMYLQRDNHATGLIRLLIIGLQVLTLLEFVVRSKLEEEEADIAGLYSGNPSLQTSRPTAEALLGAFNYIDLICMHQRS